MAAGAEPSCAAMSHISHARWPTHRLQPRMLMTLRDFRNTFFLCHYTTYQVQPLVQLVQYNLPVAPTLLHGANTRSTSSRSTGQPASLTASASRWPPSKSKLTQARLCLTPVCFMLEVVLSYGGGAGVERETRHRKLCPRSLRQDFFKSQIFDFWLLLVVDTRTHFKASSRAPLK